MNKYRADIDGLRTIAVTSVVLYHASLSAFSGGFVGVDVFFVISGYLITSLLLREVESTGKIDFTQFYSKRFKRLYPAMLTTVIFCIIFWAIFFLGNEQDTKQFYRSIRWSVFGFGNVFFRNKTGGYFDSATEENPLLHFWSLGVEEQFYLVWPLLIILAHNYQKRFWSETSLRLRIGINLMIVGMLSFLFTEYLILVRNNSQDAFYLTHPRAWELAAGGILGVFATNINKFILRLSKLQVNFFGISGLILILYPIFSYDHSTLFPGHFAIPPVIGTMILIIVGTHQSSLISRTLSVKPLVHIGILSYGWYLWHWPLLAFLRIHHLGEVPPLSERLIAVVLSLFLAQLSLSYIEKPFRHGTYLNKLKPKKVIAGFLLASIFVASLGTSLGVIERIFLKQNLGDRFVKLMLAHPQLPGECLPGKPDFEKCNYPGSADSQQIILWGDSHAHTYTSMLEELSLKEKTRVQLFSMPGLVPLVGAKSLYKVEAGKDVHHEDSNAKVLEIIKASANNTSVILASRWTAYVGVKPISVLDTPTFLTPELTIESSLDFLKQGINQTLQQLSDAGVKKVLLLLPFIEYKYEMKRCFNELGCPLPRQVVDDYHRPVREILIKAASQFENVRVIDPIPYFCDTKICPQIGTYNTEKYPIVHDDDHPSVMASKLLGKFIYQDLEWLVTE